VLAWTLVAPHVKRAEPETASAPAGELEPERELTAA
jgi:hypothetical protein